MKLRAVIVAATPCAIGLPTSLQADEFIIYPAEDVDAPQFITVDLKNKKLQLDRSGRPRSAQLRNRENLHGRLMLQGVGVEIGLGWTFSVDQETGKFVVSASGDEVAFIIFGACTTFPAT